MAVLEKKKKKKKRIMIIMIQYLKIPCSQQVAKSSAQKETKKKREKHSKKKITYRFQKEREKKKQHNTSPALVPRPFGPPHFPRHTALPCAFLKSPTCALHMLLPGANETKTVLCFTIIGIRRMCEHKASPTPALMWPVGDL